MVVLGAMFKAVDEEYGGSMLGKGWRGIWLWWLIVLIGTILTSCKLNLAQISPPLKYSSREPTPEEQALYGYLITLAAGDFERLQTFASPQAFTKAQQWWQRLSEQEREHFRQNIGLLSRTGKFYGHVLRLDNPGPLLVFEPERSANVLYYYSKVELRGTEGYTLKFYPGFGEESTEVHLCLFVLQLYHVKVRTKRVENWERICWMVYLYPGEVFDDSCLIRYSGPLQCFAP